MRKLEIPDVETFVATPFHAFFRVFPGSLVLWAGWGVGAQINPPFLLC